MLPGRRERMVAVTTRSGLRSWRFFPSMLVATGRVRRQLRGTPGIVRWATVVAGPREFWTVTVWRNRHEMQEFMRSGAHGEIMWSLPRWLESFWLARWRPGTRELGGWDGMALASLSPPREETEPRERRRNALEHTSGAVVRLRATPRGALELVRLRRRIARDEEALRVATGIGTARRLYLFALWRGKDGPERLFSQWVPKLGTRLRGDVWALECFPEHEFGQWDGLRLRAPRPVTRRPRAARGSAGEPRHAALARSRARARRP